MPPPSNWLADHAVQVFGVLVVVVGLFVVGLRDLLRFSWTRVWAISGVCFDESVRRRVLWIIPVTIVALIAVIQLQRPLDELDAIRETTKFCLFGTGLVVVVSTIILACTNLPREIENRVIFTVVTKPTTRLEIILGKVVGFSRVSGTILLLMGLFTYAYLHLRAYSFERDIRHRLAANEVEQVSRPSFQHYADAGLLNAESLVTPRDMNIYALAPTAGSKRRYPVGEGYVMIPFKAPPDMVASADPDGLQHPGQEGMRIQVRVGYDPATTPEPTNIKQTIRVEILDPATNALLGKEINNGQPFEIPSPDGSRSVQLPIAPSATAQLAKYPFFYVAITNATGNGLFWINDNPADPAVSLQFLVTSQQRAVVVNPTNPFDPGQPAELSYTGRQGLSGQQVKGDPAGKSQVCIYQYRGIKLADPVDGKYPVELRLGIEKNGERVDHEIPTYASLQVTNIKTGVTSAPVVISPENNRPYYAALPADALSGGNFDVAVRCLSDSQWINLNRRSLSVVKSQTSFAFNLFKSCLIMWLLSILVTAVSVFASTFLSWPIAVVFTLMILLGHWGFDELGDAANAGVGRSVAGDMGLKDPAAIKVVSESVEKLNSMLRVVSAALPDIGQFSATDEIERGLTIPLTVFYDSGKVLLGFGLPFVVLAYVRFKNQEVAP